MSAMRWDGVVLRIGHTDIASMWLVDVEEYEVELYTGPGVENCHQLGKHATEPARRHILSWAFAVTGSECPELGAPWMSDGPPPKALRWEYCAEYRVYKLVTKSGMAVVSVTLRDDLYYVNVCEMWNTPGMTLEQARGGVESMCEMFGVKCPREGGPW